ncbi:hypothetical protein JRO89_XS09G0064100 [Xanthoceras sorbifolium]|uniref:Uncharacterized protein n=1 Tax=Xanthoceras sorbifolium TaxID=99658 RepID=A0ABQ8HKP2_9ROSI|nr:hypothetical protein JRO89_XS09G0064100 [Xanthoceras sorbifolium]
MQRGRSVLRHIRTFTSRSHKNGCNYNNCHGSNIPVRKLEQGIPEDDPPNPVVIADLVIFSSSLLAISFSQKTQAPAHNSTYHAKVSGQTTVDSESARAAYHAGLAHVEEFGAADDQHDHIWHRRKKKRNYGEDISQTTQAPAHNSTYHAKVSGQTAVDSKSARAAYHAALAYVEKSRAADDQHDHIWHSHNCPSLQVSQDPQVAAIGNFQKSYSPYSEVYNPVTRFHLNFRWRNELQQEVSAPNHQFSAPNSFNSKPSLVDTLQAFMQDQQKQGQRNGKVIDIIPPAKDVEKSKSKDKLDESKQNDIAESYPLPVPFSKSFTAFKEIES